MRAKRRLAVTAAAVGWILATATPALADTCVLEQYFESDTVVGIAVGVTVMPVPGTGQVNGTVDFGDGTLVPITAGGASAVVIYEEPGTYPVTFTGQGVLDGQPCSDTAKLVGVYTAHELVAAFNASPSDDLIVDFDASSSQGPIEMYGWDFGDGSYGDGVTAQHEYAAPGTYQVTLSVMGMLGIDEATASLSLGDVTVLDFGGAGTLVEAPAQAPPAVVDRAGESLVAEEAEEEPGGIDPSLFALLLAAVAAGLVGTGLLVWMHQRASAKQKAELEAAVADAARRKREEEQAIRGAEESRRERDRLYNEMIGIQRAQAFLDDLENDKTDNRIELTPEQLEALTEGMAEKLSPHVTAVVEFFQTFGEKLSGVTASYDETEAAIDQRARELEANGEDPGVARAQAEQEYKDGLAALERFDEALDGTGQALAESAKEAVIDEATGKVQEVIKGVDDKLNDAVEIHDHPPPAVPTD